MEFEEVKYGMLMMVLCDREGKVKEVWITFGSMHEVRAFRERKKRSVWLRELVENCVVYGDKGYRGCGELCGASVKGWSGDCSACGTSTTCQIVMNSDK